MKRFRRAFGRMALVAIAIALQMLVMFLGAFRLINITVGMQVFTAVVVVLTVLHVFNREMVAEAKLTWLLVIMISPILGTALYALFSKNNLSRKERKLLQKTMRKGVECMLPERAAEWKIPEPYCGQSRYITNMCATLPSGGKDVSFYPSGEEFFAALVEELKFAKEFIFMEYFILQPGKMWNTILKVLQDKVREGVEVRVIFDDFGCLTKLPPRYEQVLRSAGIKCVCFNPLRPVASAVHNNRDHRKITVIDGMTGFVGGANLADEYINATHPFGRWKDSALRLRGRAVQELTVMFLQNFDIQSGISEDFSNYIPAYPENGNDGVVQPFADGPRPVYGDHVGENVLLNLINQSTRTLYITTPYLVLDNKLKNALCSASRRGVDVRIVTPHIPDKKIIFQVTRSHYATLQKAGVKIFEYIPGFVHAKQIISDGTVAAVGTVNLDYRSLVHHYECGVWLYGCNCVKSISEDFENLFCHSADMTGFTQSRLSRLFCSVLTTLMPLL